jgi:hypothetical protein
MALLKARVEEGMSDRLTVTRARTVGGSVCDLPEEFAPASLSQTQRKRQIALYIEAAALKPLLSSGITSEQVAEAFIELAVQGVQRSSGRVAAALMLQKATRHAFESSGSNDRARSPNATTPYRP